MKLTTRCLAPAACAALLLCAAPAFGQDDAFARAVNGAIDRGVQNLRRTQTPDGAWQRGLPRETTGATALAGLTLLESGVAANDPAVRKAAAAVRKGATAEKYVYTVSLCILFLDRLGDPQDEPFIEALAVRLLAGQDRTRWAWSYNCPVPEPAEVARLTAALKNHKEMQARPVEPRLRTPNDLAQEVKDQITRVYQTPARPSAQEVDNSNTQFALLALWVARRHGIPSDYAIAMVEKRLRATQRPHGGWTYRYPDKVIAEEMFLTKDYQPSAAMTCSGLLGMALAHGILDPSKGLRFDLTNDPAVRAGFQALGNFVGTPTGDVTKATRLMKPGRAYYFLWSLERMAVLYGLTTIGNKDWYRWGAEILLANQGADGSWAGDFAAGSCDTSFALLFLKRANVAKDLTVRLQGKGKDPGKTPVKLLEMINKEFAPGIENRRGAGRQSYRTTPASGGRQPPDTSRYQGADAPRSPIARSFVRQVVAQGPR